HVADGGRRLRLYVRRSVARTGVRSRLRRGDAWKVRHKHERENDSKRTLNRPRHLSIIGHSLRVVSVLAVLAPVVLVAQLRGIVVDQTGLPLPGSHIELQRDGRVVASLNTAQDGGFDLQDTQPTDVIVVSLDGFETARVAPEAARRIVLLIARATE